MPGSSYLYSRCAIKTFKENAKSLLDVLSEDSKETLREIGILQLFNMPTIQQNIPLLYYIIRSYSARRNAFLLGNFYVKFTMNHVALILGLPNRRKEFQFDRIPLSNLKHKELVQELADLTVEDSSPTLQSRRINALIKYVLTAFFFPLKGLKVPTCLLKFKGLEDFAAVNWPKAIHTFLYSHFAYMKEIAIGEEMKNLGYLEGCSVILVVSKSTASYSGHRQRLRDICDEIYGSQCGSGTSGLEESPDLGEGHAEDPSRIDKKVF
ncbi:hypothetical protein KSP40_PGU006035 [Platanthera guangdongensis]|uniref:Uncharacterized protein n=1 Tax=Platanthera guangdongensis TaxID=2320717 RepID=A0ABR2M6A5_9ASPA